MDARVTEGPRIGVAALSLGSGFPGQMYSLLKHQLRPGHALVECSAVLEKTPEHLRSRLLALLETAPRPTALIGICIRPDARTMAAYRAAGVPIVLVDEEVAGASTVASDNCAGGLLAARHLIASGRRSLGIVTGQTRLDGGYNALERLKGFAKGLAEAGLSLPPEHVVEVTNYSRKEGVEAMGQWLDAGRQLDGVFCAAGDVCATGLVSAAQARGVKVPDGLAVIGYDDNPAAAQSELTTLRQPLQQIAREAYRLATEEGRELLARPRRLLLEPELVARASTRPVPSAPATAPRRAVSGGR